MTDLASMLRRHAALRDEAAHALVEAGCWLEVAALALLSDGQLEEAQELTTLATDLLEHALDCRATSRQARGLAG